MAHKNYNPKQCGPYKIEWPEAVYVGESTNIEDRWSRHRSALQANVHYCKELQEAWNKYGPDAFEFRKLESCAPNHLTLRQEYYHIAYRRAGKKVVSRPRRHPFRVIKELQEQILSLWNSGLGVREIGRRLEISYQAVSKHLKLLKVSSEQIKQRTRQVISLGRKAFLASEAGAEYKRQLSQAYTIFNPARAAKIRKLSSQGKSYLAIAKQFGVTGVTIRRVVLKLPPYDKI